MRRNSFVAVVVLSFIGCGPGVTLVSEPVPVNGKVTFANGKPVRDVLLVLQPIEKGRPDNLKLGPDGSFNGSAVPGKYGFFFAPQDGKAAMMAAIPEKFRSYQIEQTVTISGGEFTITLP